MKLSKKWLNATFSSFLPVSHLAFASGRRNPQSTKTSGFSSALTHMSSVRIEHKGLRPLINPMVSHFYVFYQSADYLITSTPMYFLSASGTVTEPSAFW